MGKHTIAEYADNATIVEELRSFGIDYPQGNGIREPQPIS